MHPSSGENVFQEINHDRRRFLGTAAMTIAAAQFGMSGSTKAQLPNIKRGSNTSFGPLRQIDAGVLNVAYAELALPKALRSFCYMAGLTTFTAMWLLPHYWH